MTQAHKPIKKPDSLSRKQVLLQQIKDKKGAIETHYQLIDKLVNDISQLEKTLANLQDQK